MTHTDMHTDMHTVTHTDGDAAAEAAAADPATLAAVRRGPVAANAVTAEWERRDLALWADLDGLPEEEFRARIDALAGELPEGHPVAAFERAAAFDSTGHSDLAVPRYRAALAAGLPGERHRRAVVQLSSSLRNTGRAAEALALLLAERGRGADPVSDHLGDAVAATLALVLATLGREREAVAVAVGALAPHLPRYQRSMGNYARLLVEPETGE